MASATPWAAVRSFGSVPALGAACLLLDPDRVVLASILYPVGVSLYSVALVAYPSLIAPASSAAERGRQAGWIYAIAGWLGSALGIGMGRNLGHVPPAFVLGRERSFSCRRSSAHFANAPAK